MTKFIKGVVAIVALTSVSAVASALTVQEVLDLREAGFSTSQIEAMFGASSSSSSSSSESFSYDYTVKRGSSNSEVRELQKCLNSLGHNAGVVDGVFGGKTQSAVVSYQSANGLSADGVVGPRTGASLEDSCDGKVEDEEVEDDDDEEPRVETKEELTLGGEGDIDNFEVNAEDDAKADSRDEHVATLEFDVDEGDVELERVDLFLRNNDDDGSDNSHDPWENIDRVRLVVNGDEIADEDVTSKKDWDDHGTSTGGDDDVFSIELTGDVVFDEGDNIEVEVIIDTSDEVDTGDTEVYDIWAEMRFVNAEGVLIYAGNDEDSAADHVEFEIDPLGAFDINFSENNDSPDDDDSLDLSSDTSETLAIVDVEIDEDQGGTLEDATVVLTITPKDVDNTSPYDHSADDLVGKVKLKVDGKTVDTDDDNTDFTADNTAVDITYNFDLDDIDVDAEDELEFEVVVDFEEIDGTSDETAFVGATVRVKTLTVDGEDASGDDFTTQSETTSYAPTWTVTAGTIDVTWTDAVVYSDGQDDSNSGDYILFAVEVENNTGSSITSMEIIGNWSFDVDGYAADLTGLLVAGDDDWGVTSTALPTVGTAVTATTPSGATLADGDSYKYYFMVPYTATSSADFTIELEEIGAENVPVAEVWRD